MGRGCRMSDAARSLGDDELVRLAWRESTAAIGALERTLYGAKIVRHEAQLSHRGRPCAGVRVEAKLPAARTIILLCSAVRWSGTITAYRVGYCEDRRGRVLGTLTDCVNFRAFVEKFDPRRAVL